MTDDQYFEVLKLHNLTIATLGRICGVLSALNENTPQERRQNIHDEILHVTKLVSASTAMLGEIIERRRS